MSAASVPSATQGSIAGMSRLVTVKDEVGARGVDGERGRTLCGELEASNILYFPRTPFAFPDDDLQFLLGLKQTDASFHKNIAYRPAEDRITGLDKSAQGPEADRLRAIVAGYSRRVGGIFGLVTATIRGQMETGLRKLSAARRAGASGAIARAQ